MGLYGGKLISDTATYDGPFCAIHAFEDSTLATGTTSGNIDGDFNGKIITAGTVLVGRFDRLQFSGTPNVLAYYGHKDS